MQNSTSLVHFVFLLVFLVTSSQLLPCVAQLREECSENRTFTVLHFEENVNGYSLFYYRHSDPYTLRAYTGRIERNSPRTPSSVADPQLPATRSLQSQHYFLNLLNFVFLRNASRARLLGGTQPWLACPEPFCLGGSLDGIYDENDHRFILRGKHIWNLTVGTHPLMRDAQEHCVQYVDAASANGGTPLIYKGRSQCPLTNCDPSSCHPISGINLPVDGNIDALEHTRSGILGIIEGHFYFSGQSGTLERMSQFVEGLYVDSKNSILLVQGGLAVQSIFAGSTHRITRSFSVYEKFGCEPSIYTDLVLDGTEAEQRSRKRWFPQTDLVVVSPPPIPRITTTVSTDAPLTNITSQSVSQNTTAIRTTFIQVTENVHTFTWLLIGLLLVGLFVVVLLIGVLLGSLRWVRGRRARSRKHRSTSRSKSGSGSGSKKAAGRSQSRLSAIFSGGFSRAVQVTRTSSQTDMDETSKLKQKSEEKSKTKTKSKSKSKTKSGKADKGVATVKSQSSVEKSGSKTGSQMDLRKKSSLTTKSVSGERPKSLTGEVTRSDSVRTIKSYPVKGVSSEETKREPNWLVQQRKAKTVEVQRLPSTGVEEVIRLTPKNGPTDSVTFKDVEPDNTILVDETNVLRISDEILKSANVARAELRKGDKLAFDHYGHKYVNFYRTGKGLPLLNYNK